jgi:hypothetical protein
VAGFLQNIERKKTKAEISEIRLLLVSFFSPSSEYREYLSILPGLFANNPGQPALFHSRQIIRRGKLGRPGENEGHDTIFLNRFVSLIFHIPIFLSVMIESLKICPVFCIMQVNNRYQIISLGLIKGLQFIIKRKSGQRRKISKSF